MLRRRQRGRIPLGITTFVGPLVVLAFTDSLFYMVVVLVAARALAWITYFIATMTIVPAVRKRIRMKLRLVPDLFKFGAWRTVSNLVSPLMVYMDRFLIGVVLTASAVAYYAMPWEVVPKLLVIPGAMSAVLFPAFSYWSGNRIDQAKRFFRTGLKAVALTLFPLVLLVVAGAKPGLSWWLDSSFARESALPMQILAVGVLLNGAAGIPFALIQGLGRPDITARLHLLELPVYAALLWFLLREFGIVGAAIAWSFRVMLDFVLLDAMSHRLLSFSFNDVKILAATVLAGVSAAGAVMLPTTAGLQIALAVLFGIAWIPAAWTFVITAQEKRFLQSLVAKVSS